MARLRILFVAGGAFASLMAGGTAQAQTAPQVARTMPVEGNVPQVCTLQPGRIRSGGLVNFRGLDGDTLRIEELTDRRTLAANATSATIDFEAVCNFPHRVRLESQNNGLWPTDGRMGTTAEGFAYALPYSARITWGEANRSLAADAKVRRLKEERVNVDTATAGNLQLRIEIESGASNVATNAPVLAGVYGDTLRIYLEPR